MLFGAILTFYLFAVAWKHLTYFKNTGSSNDSKVSVNLRAFHDSTVLYCTVEFQFFSNCICDLNLIMRLFFLLCSFFFFIIKLIQYSSTLYLGKYFLYFFSFFLCSFVCNKFFYRCIDLE